MTRSRIFLYLCLSFIIGLGLVSFLIISVFAAGIILMIGLSLILVWWRHEWKLVVAGLCLISAAAGVYRGNQAIYNSPSGGISLYNDSGDPIKLLVTVISEPAVGINNVKYEVETNNRNGIQIPAGKILIITNKYPLYEYGNVIEIQGKLKTPKDSPEFSYKDYLSRYEIYSLMYYPEIRDTGKNEGSYWYAKILWVKEMFEGNIRRILPEPHSSFLAGLLLGSKTQIPSSLMDKFSQTGTTHILAVSGFNISIIAWVVFWIFMVIGIHRYWAFWLAVLIVILFTVVTGASASVIRASIMGIIVLTAMRLGRLSQTAYALALTGMAMVSINPKLLRFDIGFQLSFLATLGLVLFSSLLDKKFSQKEFFKESLIWPVMKTTFVATLAAQILVIPVIAYHFRQVSLISPLANLLILPAVPFSMAVGFFGGVTAFVWPLLGQIIGYVAWILLNYQIKTVEILSQIPFSAITFENLHWGWVVTYYSIAVVLYWRFVGLKNIIDNK